MPRIASAPASTGSSSHFDLVSHWRLRAPVEHVWSTLANPAGWPAWWPYVQQVQTLRDGGPMAWSMPGFACSDALYRSGLTWTPAPLDRRIADPESLAPGQRKGYQLEDAQVRADIVACLAALLPAGR